MSERKIGDASQAASVSVEFLISKRRCLGCRDCDGLCPEIIDLLYVPDVVLNRKAT